MFEFLAGTISMLLTIGAFIAGVWFGTKCLQRPSVTATVAEETEEKKAERIAEQKAFDQQMAYGIEAAYRMPRSAHGGDGF